MPELIQCPECGRKLKVPETLQGKSVKCPGCQAVFTATFGAGEDAEEEEIPTAKRRAPEPEEEDEEEARPRKKRREVADEDDDDDDDEEERRPRRRRGRPSRGVALGMVGGPGVALMVVGILGLVCMPIGLVFNLIAIAGAGAGAGGNPGFQQRPGQFGGDNPAMTMFSGTTGIILNVIGFVVSIVIVLGAVKMRKLESYGLAMTSCILAMLPMVSPCCLLGLPFGIWGVVVLSKPEVKSAFE
jgi:hypothetical protein